MKFKDLIGLITMVLYLNVSIAEAQKIDPFHYQPQKKVTCTQGAVASANTLASKVGVSILQKGGNAIDAAIATQLALAVVYPGAGNIGGGGFMLAHLKNGKNIYMKSATDQA